VFAARIGDIEETDVVEIGNKRSEFFSSTTASYDFESSSSSGNLNVA